MPSAVAPAPVPLVMPLWHLKVSSKGASRTPPLSISARVMGGNCTCGVTVITAQVG